MGRPSKVAEKRQIILDAYEEVILREGYGQASQRKIAEQAGINQPMIHHYFTGGDDMLDALIQRVIERYTQALNDFANSSEETSLEQVLSFACSAEFHQLSTQNEVFFSCIIGESHHDQRILDKVATVYQHLLTLITGYLVKARVKNSEEMAYLVMCLILGHDWAKQLGFGEKRNDDMVNNLTKLIES